MHRIVFFWRAIPAQNVTMFDHHKRELPKSHHYAHA